MARGGASPAPPLPSVSFVKVTDEVTQQASGVSDQVARSYGYNGPSVFQQEKHYIRYIEPLESDLAVQVEYDMDEQDQEWVDALNNERKAQQLDKVSYETFEIVMDRLEKEWFDLTKNIPKSDMALPSEDSTCAICDDSEGENTNAIVFCDGCNLAVHQDCYGVPYIPEGQWLCRKCTVSPENPVECILCPKEGGAFKQTVSGDWVHLLCAIWVPETAVANEVFMEPITGVDKISKQRWKLRCSVCGEKKGACIQCSKASCFTAFHATCARKHKFLMPMKSSQGSEAPVLACYCERHLPREQQEARAAANITEHSDGSDIEGINRSPKSSKSARAYTKQYKPSPPLVPRIIVNRILQYISRIQVRHKAEFVHLVCRYWSLKRDARRGAPLLKRLHLEPWTALSGSKQQTDEEKAMKLDHTKRLRLDLERLRIIADVVRRRERVKQAQAEAIQDVLLHFLFPHEGPLRLAFQRITAHDRQNGYFKTPVNKVEVPDYYDIIKDPMCWDMIDQKLDRHEYLDLAEFKRDINLVLNNAMIYNEVNTPFYKTAHRIQAAAQAPLAELDKLVHHRAPEPESAVGEKIDSESQPDELHVPLPPIGDLEPPLDLLNLLVSEESIRNDTNLIVTSTPTESLLNYELPNIRPPPPPLPPLPSARGPLLPSQRTQQKQKLDRRTALKRKREERHAALDASPGFRATRTRSGAVAAAAFEAEAIGAPFSAGESSGVPEFVEGSTATAATAHSKSKKHRKSTASPVQDLPLTVEDVDNRQSFKMFEVGWILPPDQRRGGRAPVERQPLPPPRKRTKSTHEKSRILSQVPNLNSPATGVDEGQLPAQVMDAAPPLVESVVPVTSITTKDPGTLEPPDISEPSLPPAPPDETEPEPQARHPLEPEPAPDAPPEMSIALEVGPAPEPAVPEEDIRVAPEPVSVSESITALEPPSANEAPEPKFGPEPPPSREPSIPAALPLIESTPVEAQLTLDADPMEIDEAPQPEEATQEQAPTGAPVTMEESQPPAQEEEEEEYTGPLKIIYIDELDTPATRREKYMRKKAERQAARERAATAWTQNQTVAGPSRVREHEPKDAMDVDSDLTDLSDLDDDLPNRPTLHAQVAPVPPQPARSKEPPTPMEPGIIAFREGEKLEGGTLVWAKVESFPWWPAVVFEEDDPEIPDNVLANAPNPPDNGVALVRFYEKNHVNNWAWVKLKNMRYLGEDDALDAQMLAPTSKFQRWRSANKRTECRNAYQDALAEMEAEAETLGRIQADGDELVAAATTATAICEDLIPAAMGADSPMTDVDSTAGWMERPEYSVSL